MCIFVGFFKFLIILRMPSSIMYENFNLSSAISIIIVNCIGRYYGKIIINGVSLWKHNENDYTVTSLMI